MGYHESCWLINFKNGYKVILSEKVYREKYKKETPVEDIESEEHWFLMSQCIEKNPDVDILD